MENVMDQDLTGAVRRRAFKQALRQALAGREVGFVGAELGRHQPAGEPVWFVTVNRPVMGVQRFSLDFPDGTDPYSPETLNDLIARLVQAMSNET